ncbi:hypothetical protein [Burkholderia sp. Ac-20353]|uniref:hypothetical protein n=1 Tax=Burkholderia sp. Ac-20353 TaxID=2703894 RepID=UPI00197B26F6|nr:hypothetical protein [Burkholderia sp. Ac-20353]MBN3787846.1 hypothetical protein [Burkholderia sp. Ac-20353]
MQKGLINFADKCAPGPSAMVSAAESAQAFLAGFNPSLQHFVHRRDVHVVCSDRLRRRLQGA